MIPFRIYNLSRVAHSTALAPYSEVPLHIREAWVGLILPCDPYLGYPDSGPECGVLSGTETSRNRCGFSVPQDQAITILGKKNPKAATYWKEHGFPKANEYFCFSETEARIVNGVTRQGITEVTDEMLGYPGR